MTAHWPLVALTILGSIGLGLYLAAAIGYFKGGGGEIRLPALIFTILFLSMALVATTLSLGNPSRIANIFGHLQSGFSMAMLGVLVLAIVSLYQIRLNHAENNTQNTVVTIIGVIIAIIICYGISLMYMKPSRPALYNWSVPLYLISFAASVGMFGYCAILSFIKSEKDNLFRVAKYITLILQAVAIIGFAVNLSFIGSTDRILNLPLLLSGELSLYFYLLAIIIGLVLPAVFELLSNRAENSSKLFTCMAFASVVVGGIGFSIILSISAGYIRKLIWL